MSIVLQLDRRSNRTYAYHNDVIWNKELKRSESTRTLIGRIGESGEIIPTSGTRRKHRLDEDLISKEIQEYNTIVQKKKAEAELIQSPEGFQLQEINKKYDELSAKYNDIMSFLHDIVNSANHILNK